MTLENSIVQNLNYETGKITLRKNNKVGNFEGLIFLYLIVISLFFIYWDENCTRIDENMKIIEFQYPYEVLNDKYICITVK